MTVLIESDSLIQFIIATHLRTTVFRDDTVDLIMYDSMPNAKKIYENIRATNIFRNCYLVTSVLAVGHTKLNKKEKAEKGLRWLEMLAFPGKGTRRIVTLDRYDYDCFVFCANGIFIDGLYNVCKKANRQIQCIRYEGSLTSYLHDHENQKGKLRGTFERMVKCVSGKADLAKDVSKYYFFEPDLIQFSHNYHIEKLEKITTMEASVKAVLNDIFEFIPEENKVEEAVVAFEDGNLFYMNNEEEISLYSEAAEICGKENFVVKLHPRRQTNRFEAKSITANQSIAPWEIYLLNQDMSGKTLITSASGSVFTSLLYFGMDVRVIMVYKCIQAQIPLIQENFETFLNTIEKCGKKKNMLIPKDCGEFYEILKQIKYR